MTGWLGRFNRLLHRFNRLDDVIAMWNVERARDVAWTNAETLWMCSAAPPGSPAPAEFLASLDRMVGFASRGLLVPSESVFHRVARRLHLGSSS